MITEQLTGKRFHPWTIGRTHAAESLVLFKDLARAVRREASKAVAYWWGISGQTVTKWRKALGVKSTEGDHRLRVAIGRSPALWPALAAMHAKIRDPIRDRGRRAKIAAAKRGTPRPAHVHAEREGYITRS
jgi:hypothetical protein